MMYRLTRRSALAAGLLAGLGCTARSAAIAIPFKEVSGRVHLPLEVDGKEVQALLDNGAGSSIDQTIELSAKPRGALALLGPFGRHGQRRRKTKVNDVDLEQLIGVPVALGDAQLLTDPLIADVKGWSSDLLFVLGYEPFSRWIVGVDYDAGNVTLHERVGFEPPAGFSRVELTPFLAHNRKWMADIDLGLGLPTKALVDLGSSTALCLSLPMAEKLKLKPLFKRRWNHMIGEPMQLGVATTPKVGFGGVTLEHVATEIFPVAPPVQWASYDAVIGAPFLSRFKIYYDLPLGRLYVAPGQRIDWPFLHTPAGFFGSYERGRFSVVAVMPKGPADRVGLRTGDVIAAIDGKSVNAGLLRGLNAEAGRAMTLTLADGRTVRISPAEYMDRY